MNVVCKFDNLNSIVCKKSRERIKRYIRTKEGDIDLVVGKQYVVYGIVFWDNSPWYYLCVDDQDEYPTPYAAEFFDILNDNLSSYWKLLVVNNIEGEITSSLVFDDWYRDSFFYEKLIEGEKKAVESFEKHRILIDKEASLYTTH